jgi:2-polyprenyl-6-methoxyphenol hydroxylase-like FAD-dependent oxidoreductase
VDAETVYWWTALNAPGGEILPQKKRKAFLLWRYRGWPFGLPEAIAATAEDVILQNDLVDRPPSDRYVKGRVALLGDAAHPTTPNLGQGANMAIDDAIVMARCLREAGSVEEGLAWYQKQRLGRTRQIVERSWAYGRMCLWTSPIAVALRERMVRWTPERIMRRTLRWQILESVGDL